MLMKMKFTTGISELLVQSRRPSLGQFICFDDSGHLGRSHELTIILKARTLFLGSCDQIIKPSSK